VTGAPTIEVRLRIALADDGFFRRCYDDWVSDAAYYRAHPEIDCPSDYLDVPPFDQYVREIVESEVQEFVETNGFAAEVVR
jgi:hypothetical protein